MQNPGESRIILENPGLSRMNQKTEYLQNYRN